MTQIFIDTEDFSEEETLLLSCALSGIAEADVPLVVEIKLVSKEEIQTLNRTIRGIDAVTDVLSFPALEQSAGDDIHSKDCADLLDEENRLLLGSVAICTERAKEQAAEYGHSERREIFYLAVHGILHCLGYDHETQSMRAQMREKEEEIMQKMNLGREA